MTRSAARLRLLLVLVVACAVYAPSLGNRFAMDDRIAAMAVRDDGTPNRLVSQLQPLGAYFSTNYWQGFLADDILYRPVTVLSYALVHAAWGRHAHDEAGQALPQHAVNVLLHVLATWLVYRLARRVALPRGAALLAALVFAVHALHSEVVATVVGRSELLAFTCGGLATLLFAGGARDGPGLRIARGLGVSLALFTALCAKESAVAWIPFLLLASIVRALREGRANASLAGWLARPLWTWLLVGLPPLALFLLLRARMIGLIGADPGAWEDALVRATPGSPLGNALVQWVHALLATLLPTRLSADWGPMVFAPVPSPVSLAAIGATVLLAAAAGIALWGWRTRPVVLLAAAAWFGHSFLVSNVPFRIGTDYAERLYYAPSLGAALLVAWAATRWPAARARAGLGLVALWCAWNVLLVLQRNPVWRDNETLHRHETVHQPRSARMQLQWASELEKRGEFEAARRHLEAAVELLPEHAAAWNHLGTVHARAGRNQDALRCFERATRATGSNPAVRVAAAVNLARASLSGSDDARVMQALELARTTDARLTAERVPELRQLFAQRLPHAWLDEFFAALEQALPRARAWAYERAWLAQDARRPAAAVTHARRALAEPLAPAARAQMLLVLASGLAAGGDRTGAIEAAERVLAEASAPQEVRAAAANLLQRLR